MYDTTKNFIQRLRGDKRKQKQLGLMLFVLSLIVASGVTWQLRITGITMSDVPCCGQEEHVHTPECTEQTLICGLTEGDSEGDAEELPPAEPELVCDISEHTHGDDCYHIQQELICDVSEHSHGDECYEIEWVLDCEEDHEHDENCPQKEIRTLVCEVPEHTHGEGCYYIEKELICDVSEHTHGDECYLVPETEASHVHTEDCWETKYICGYDEEHTHTLACYSNPDADVESPSQWESTLPSLTGNRAADLAAVARSQVNYRESDDNFIVSEDGTSRQGITRYGQWYGNPYGEWDAMFAVFCLRYAGIGESVIPGNSGCYAWAAQLGQLGMFRSPSDHNPALGDLVFFDQDEDGTPDHVGIVIRADGPFFSAVEGGREDCVDIYSYDRSDSCVFGFVPVEEEEPEETTEESTEETVPEDLFPQALDVLVYEDATFEQWVEGAVPMTVSGLMPEGLTAKACPVSGVLEGREVLWAFFIGLYDEEGRLWQSPEAPLTVTMTMPNYLDELTEDQEEEPAQPMIYYVPAEGPEEEIPTERAGDLLAFEISSGATYASAYPAPAPEAVTLEVKFYEDETYADLLEDAPEMTVTGILPEMAEARAYLVDLELPEAEVLWAFHLAVFNEEGEIIEPEALTANLQMPQTYAMDEESAISMYQVPEEGQQEPVPTQQTETGITFEAAKPTVYAAVLMNISDEDALRLAAQTGGEFVLEDDIDIKGDDIDVTAPLPFTLNLNGHTITANGKLFKIASGASLTLCDEERDPDRGTEVSGGIGLPASLQGDLLTYYVTETRIASLGTTSETLVKYEATLTGRIAGGIAVADGGSFTLEGGAICGSSEYAVTSEGGAVTVNGGYICDSRGGIQSKAGGTVTMNDGVIAGNTADYGGGIHIEGGTLNMDGGIISGNDASIGGGGGIYADQSTVKLYHGYITNNIGASSDPEHTGGGGVLCYSGCHLTVGTGDYVNPMYITANKACSGGGISTYNMDGLGSGDTLVMNSGFVTGNLAYEAEGGGMAVRARSSATITGGYITNNVKANEESWGGGGIFGQEYSEITITKALITGNHSDGFGGGVTGCSTGTVMIQSSSGAAVYGNTANGTATAKSAKNEDGLAQQNPVFMKDKAFQDYYCALVSVVKGAMLGGGSENWVGSADSVPVKTDSPDDIITASILMGLTAHPNAEDVGTAQGLANVFITGNTSATHGGGVLTNGILTFGNGESKLRIPSTLTINAKKALNGEYDDGKLADYRFGFRLLDENKTEICKVYNDDNGLITFPRIEYTEPGEHTYYMEELLPEYPSITMDARVWKFEVTVEEKPVISEGYVSEKYYIFRPTKCKIYCDEKLLNEWQADQACKPDEWVVEGADGSSKTHYSEKDFHVDTFGITSGEQTYSYNFNNTFADKVSIAVHKKWEAADGGVPESYPEKIDVYLTKNGRWYTTPEGDEDSPKSPVTLNAGNNWSHKWLDIPTKDDQDEQIIWGIAEDVPSGWQSHLTYSRPSGTDPDPDPTDPTEPEPSGPQPVTEPEDGKTYYVGVENSVLLSIGDGDKTWNLPVWSEQNYAQAEYTLEVDGSQFYLRQGVNYLYFNPELDYQGQPTGNFFLKKSQTSKTPFSVDGEGRLYTTLNNQTYYIIGNAFSGVCATTDPSSVMILYTIPDDPGGGDNPGGGEVPGGITNDTVVTITNRPVTEVKTYGFQVNKIDSAEGTGLEGAIFHLSNADGTLLRFTGENGNYVYQSPEAAVLADGIDPNAPTSLVTGPNGVLTVSDLPAGTYTLTEVQAPEGYSFTKNDPSVEIILPDKNGEIIEVKNTKMYFELPQTGGSGVTGFISLGVLLMAAALGWWIYERNRKEGRAF